MLAGDLVTENPQGMRELIASQIAGQSHGFKLSSSSKHFLPDKTKKDHTGTLSLIEVATNGIQHIRAHFIERVGFCKNRFANGAGDVTALGGFLDHENELFHGAIIRLASRHATMDPFAISF